MIEDWLESNIDDNLKYTGNHEEVHFSCPVCAETRHRMYVNLYSGRVYCHNCGFSSNMIGLISYVEGVSWSRATAVFNDVKGSMVLPEDMSQDSIRKILDGNIRSDLTKRPIPLPEEYIPIDVKHPDIASRRAIKYLKSRKVTEKQITEHHMGYCLSGEYQGRVIIPITENGELRFWVGRDMHKTSNLKEKSPSNEDYQISKSEVLFNIDRAAREYHSCVLAEGIYDALSFGSIGVSMLGKTLYQAQLNILLDYRELLTDGIYVSVDWDAKKKATEIAETLSEFFSVKIINIPKKFDDPNKYLKTHKRSDMWGLIENAEPYTEFSGLRRMLT